MRGFSFSVLLVSIGVLLMADERVHAEFEHLATHNTLTGAYIRRAVLATWPTSWPAGAAMAARFLC